MKPLQELIRPNIRNLKPYSSARDEYKGAAASVFLDANENPYNPPNNRYPDPLQQELKARLAEVKNVSSEQIFLGNGSDEAIDILFRTFCEPGRDNVVAIDPTYGMYQVCADVNDIEYRKVPLDEAFQFSAGKIRAAADQRTKLVFLCSPNNPTGNELRRNEVEKLIQTFDGLVVFDEAYRDFSAAPTLLKRLNDYPNLVVLQTFSKAWGSAAIRLGAAFAAPEIIAVINKVKYPYNVSLPTQKAAMDMLSNRHKVEQWVKTLVEEREILMANFAQLPVTEKVFPSDANFFLARVTNAVEIYNYLVEQGIIIRNRHTLARCENCLRVTVGTQAENNRLIQALKNYKK
ncbi:MAG: histidinol-phosphate transaminase [Mediterranea sp.]|jgi:histidinol-phosphate aminotransferase|nr:histidinol-phosphate transaminase [Mediterranea sp.]